MANRILLLLFFLSTQCQNIASQINNCTEGTYGISCNQSCANCSMDSFQERCDSKGRCHHCIFTNFGDNCDMPCPSDCAAGERCHRHNGSCIQHKCQVEKFHCKECENTSICTKCETGYIKMDGHCILPASISTNGSTYTSLISTEAITSTSSSVTDLDNSTASVHRYKYYIIAGIIITLFLIITTIVACKMNKKTSKQTYPPSMKQLEECNVVEKREEKPLKPGPNSMYNLRGSVALLTEIDHSVPIGPQPQPKQVSSDYFNVRFFKISVKGLDATVQRMKETDQIFTEYQDIPSGLLEMYDHATRKEVMKRNRYKGIFPFNHSRVILEKEEHEGIHYPEYINACFIHGYRKENAYIAAQGPYTNDTMIDFWRMIWQKETKQVVMLTNIIEGSTVKCLKYWPDTEEDYGPLHVKAVKESTSPNYVIRSLTVSKGGDERHLTQYHFTAWPDKGVPHDTQAILEFREVISKDRNYEADNAMIVHCSAGIGRTGTFIALDSLLIEGVLTGKIDVINCVSKMRQQRVSVIQTPEQYIYLYEALADGLQTVDVAKCSQEDSTCQKVNSVKLLGPKSAMPLPNGINETSENGSLVPQNHEVTTDTEDPQQTTATTSQNGDIVSKLPNENTKDGVQINDEIANKSQDETSPAETVAVINETNDAKQTLELARPTSQNGLIPSDTKDTVMDMNITEHTVDMGMSNSPKTPLANESHL